MLLTPWDWKPEGIRFEKRKIADYVVAHSVALMKNEIPDGDVDPVVVDRVVLHPIIDPVANILASSPFYWRAVSSDFSPFHIDYRLIMTL